MYEKATTISNRAGIHARPAALIARTANRFAAQSFLVKEGQEANAKSIIGIIAMGAAYGTAIMVRADGTDEQEAVEAIVHLFETKFAEDTD